MPDGAPVTASERLIAASAASTATVMWHRSTPCQAAHEVRQSQSHCPAHSLRRVFQEAATVAVASAPISVDTGELSLVPEPGTRAFHDWAHAFVEARSTITGTDTSTGTGDNDALVDALRVIATTAAGSSPSCDEAPMLPWWHQQHQRQQQVAVVQQAFAARARAAIRRMQNIWQHLHPAVQHSQHAQHAQLVAGTGR